MHNVIISIIIREILKMPSQTTNSDLKMLLSLIFRYKFRIARKLACLNISIDHGVSI